MTRDPTAASACKTHLAPLRHLLDLAGRLQAPVLITALLDDLKTTGLGLNAAWNGPDFVALRTNSHVLIALAGTIGDMALHALAQRLNEMAHAQNAMEVMKLKPEIMHGIADLVGVLLRAQDSAGS